MVVVIVEDSEGWTVKTIVIVEVTIKLGSITQIAPEHTKSGIQHPPPRLAAQGVLGLAQLVTAPVHPVLGQHPTGPNPVS